jgi:hypothetical protein
VQAPPAPPPTLHAGGRRGATQPQAPAHLNSSLAHLATVRSASRSMAERRPRAATTPLWDLLERLDAELQWAILDLAGAPAAKHLRGACRAARALVNSVEECIRLSADDLATLPLRLHARFPRLTHLELAPGADSDAFADFAVAELARLSSLVALRLRDCGSLGTAAAVVVRDCCPQLQLLDLGGTGAGGAASCVQRCFAQAAIQEPTTPSALAPQAWRALARCRRWPPSPA